MDCQSPIPKAKSLYAHTANRFFLATSDCEKKTILILISPAGVSIKKMYTYIYAVHTWKYVTDIKRPCGNVDHGR